MRINDYYSVTNGKGRISSQNPVSSQIYTIQIEDNIEENWFDMTLLIAFSISAAIIGFCKIINCFFLNKFSSCIMYCQMLLL